MRRLIFGALAIAAMAACFKTTEPLPLDITIEPPGSATTLDSVSFRVIAQGDALIGIETAFGDGESLFRGTAGARKAEVTFRHRYTQSGTYEVTATATDAVLGEKTASVQVNVQ